jgi:hemerythrin
LTFDAAATAPIDSLLIWIKEAFELNSRLDVRVANSDGIGRLASGRRCTIKEGKQEMGDFAWSSEWELGRPDMDESHKALLAGFAEVAATPDPEFGSVLGKLIDTIERDFREEEELMASIDFPLFQAHVEQHARVLSAFHHIVPQVAVGNYEGARHALELWPKWFLFHVMSMDAPLAAALAEIEHRQKEDVSTA